PTAVDADIRAHRIECVDALGLAELPRPRREGVRLRGQRPNRAEIVDVAGKLAVERLFEVGDNLHILAAINRAELFDPRNLARKADAAGAVDAAGHDRLDQRPHVFFRHGALVLEKAAVARAVGHRLVLQVALAALIADRTVERMVDQQELHRAFTAFAYFLGVGVNNHTIARRHGAGGDQLG